MSASQLSEITGDEYFEQRMAYYSSAEGKLQSRVVKFLKESGFHDRVVGMTPFEGAVLGAGLGGLAGAGVGFAVGAHVGAGIGAVAGAGVGAAVGLAVVEMCKLHSVFPEYEAFNGTEEGKELGAKVIELMKNAPELDHLRCPITTMPVIDGVYIKGHKGRLYERGAIEDWIEKKGTDPFTQAKITKADLIPVEEASYESTVAGVKFLTSKLSDVSLINPHMAKGIVALISDYKTSFAEKYNQKTDELTEAFKNRAIGYETYKTKSKEQFDRYFCL